MDIPHPKRALSSLAHPQSSLAALIFPPLRVNNPALNFCTVSVLDNYENEHFILIRERP